MQLSITKYKIYYYKKIIMLILLVDTLFYFSVIQVDIKLDSDIVRFNDNYKRIRKVVITHLPNIGY